MTYRTPEPEAPDYNSDPRWQSANMEDRKIAWRQHQLPYADFTKWTPEEIQSFKQIVARHCCSVDGRWDDEGWPTEMIIVYLEAHAIKTIRVKLDVGCFNFIKQLLGMKISSHTQQARLFI